MSSYELVQISPDTIAASIPEVFKTQAKILGGFVAVLWVLEIVDSLLLRGALNRYGIRPRRVVGLRGILFAPFLHGDLGHLAANTPPLLVLGWFIMLRDLNDFWIATPVVWLVSGLGVWLLGASNSNHIGASGLVFGYLGFLLLRGYFEQSPLAIAFAVAAGLLYGSLIWGVLPNQRGKSWQGHLFGFIGGGLAARFLPELQQYFARFL
ncbi:rhomboid family intramembrane serine protease [Leptolyngbya sp. FACHB-261]|uniref:rhomboid family intramembrane serine protease n=1 Tax=Leptolyngbya sp. FACHB-261 TaxID=2692806 RepID=UPI001688D30B|nr:rhomboid family intramembrane serine protease [Leptolyngbya sp. FACHB-261]MBD2103914.1 rhomboid family intramembrane serine protease [Leptolyngbya sp. FACHB-261]